jgi:hypothetical protein
MKICSFKVTLGLLLISCTYSAFAVDPTEAKKWREDIDFYHATLANKHLNLYHSISEKDFTDEVITLKHRLADLTEPQIVMELMRLTRLVNDGHTSFSIMSQSHHHFPMRFKLFDGDVRVVKSTTAQRKYLNSKLVAIDGKPISDVLGTLSSIVQHVENEFSLRESLMFGLTQDELLHAAGITNKARQASFSFENDDGSEHRQTIDSVTMKEFVETTNISVNENRFFTSRSVTHSDNLNLSYDAVTKVAYINFSEYSELEEMNVFADAVNDFLNKQQAKNVIVDLRNNTGGDYFVGLHLIYALLLVDSLDWENGIYVLIGNRTFSAGMSNATHFRQMLNATLVGEPTGANPNGYQEVGRATLPNSQYAISYSKRIYRFQDNNTPGVQPDVLIKPSWQDYKKGEDKALQWVLDKISQENYSE